MSGDGLLQDQTLYKSVKNNKWAQTSYDKYLVESIRRSTKLPELISQLLSRYLDNPDLSLKFLDPKLKDLMPDPYVLKDMETAVDITILAINTGKKVAIFGDYDVDGATSSSIIKLVLDKFSVESSIYIPDRIKEGYGPNNEALKKLKESGHDLVITVDCGSSSYSEIEYAKSLGMQVVVLDHHKCSGDLPVADALVNPNRSDDSSGLGYLAAVGVSFLFVASLCRSLKKQGKEININLLELLDIVALGTVCDVVPLVGLNRAFVRQGIKIMGTNPNIGIKALIDIAGLNEDISVYHLGFLLGPRVNAGGRVGESDLGEKLLTSDNYEEAISLASSLDEYNNERKAIELSVLEEAKSKAITVSKDSPVIIVYGDGWHPGVIGIVAGRLKEMFRKPVAVITFEDDLGKASCRSIEGIDFGAAIIEAKEKGLLVEGGGHAMAAGFSVLKKNIGEFQSFLESKFLEKFNQIKDNFISFYAANLSISSIGLDLIRQIDDMGPFGSGNAQPKFMLKNVSILYPKILKDSHVSCLVVGDKMGKGGVRAIAFSVMENPMGEMLLSYGKALSLIVTLGINRWQGQENPQLIIHDVILM